MSAAIAAGRARKLALPPPFHAVVRPDIADAGREACRLAASGEAEAGTLVWKGPADTIDLAVILGPEEPLATARRAFLAGMVALAAAIGTHAPPEMAVDIDWPDTLLFDGARIGGGHLRSPDECAEDEEPSWLIFSGMVIASKAHAGDPGLTPFSTSLEEQGFGHDDQEALVEAFARNLMKIFEIWHEDGFEAVASRYLAHLSGEGVGAIDRIGAEALRTPTWLDPATGTVRL